MRIAAIIPARYGSTRLPGKPLRAVGGRPLIWHVWQNAKKIDGLDEIVVATDDERIMTAVREFGGKALMTSPECQSGTDRLVEAMKRIRADLYINIQGDEPLLNPCDVGNLAARMTKDKSLDVGTLCAPISCSQARNPNLVKVVLDDEDRALYFSRSPIPYPRDEKFARYWGHIGLYIYRREILGKFGDLVPSALEMAEKLEQLRLLCAGFRIYCQKTAAMEKGVDTEEDLLEFARHIAGDLAQETSPRCGKADFGRIKLIITDVDGVLTDGGLYYGASGEEIKRFDARDGLGVARAREAGIGIAVLSGRDCPALRARLRDLGIDIFKTGTLAKKAACAEIMEKAGASAEETLFIGDDLPDAEAFECCGIGVAPCDAVEEARARADWITEKAGGRGALREVVERIIAGQKKESRDHAEKN